MSAGITGEMDFDAVIIEPRQGEKYRVVGYTTDPADEPTILETPEITIDGVNAGLNGQLHLYADEDGVEWVTVTAAEDHCDIAVSRVE